MQANKALCIIGVSLIFISAMIQIILLTLSISILGKTLLNPCLGLAKGQQNQYIKGGHNWQIIASI
jgi:hypothetical protein